MAAACVHGADQSTMKASRSRTEGAGDDRLSDLPDCLLHDVLSRLMARQTVQTCVLSRRWRHLWRSAPCLDLDSREFNADEARRPPDGDEKEEDFNRFEEFADELLSRRSASALHTFRLTVGARQCQTNNSRWVRRGLRHAQPAVIAIRSDDGALEMPSLAACSQRLTTLHLHDVALHRSFAEQLASGRGFPVLEVLELTDVVLYTWFSRIASGTLENLAIDGCHINGDVAIAAPRLASLRLGIPVYRHSNHPSPRFSVEDDAASLVKASVRLWHADKSYCYIRHQIHEKHEKSVVAELFMSVANLLGRLSNVSSLELSGFQTPESGFLRYAMHAEGVTWAPVLEAILDEEHGNVVPTFGSLTTLVLDKCDVGNNLWRLLQRTRILEKVTLQNCKFSGGSLRREGIDTTTITSRLKFLEIKYDNKDTQQRLDEVLEQASMALPHTTIQLVTTAGTK